MKALLEREVCLRELEEALGGVKTGTGRVVLVSGEAGIGKTSLVDAFISSQQREARVLWGACDLLFTPRPLGPLHDIAVQMHGSLAKLLAANADPLVIFSNLLVELQQRTTIIIFEDVHWADEVTLDLLRYIGRRIAKTQALLILTYRDDELGPQHPLRIVLGDLAASPGARHLPLPPLSRLAVHALVGSRAIDAAALHRQTGGNPFFVTEVLGSTGSGIPRSVRDAVLARAARLPADARAVLDAAAVIGPRIDARLLQQITGAGVDQIEECISAGMLVTEGQAGAPSINGLAFRHELARETILAAISPPRKQSLHRAALDILRERPGESAGLVQLAHHAEGAEDREAVLAYAPAAARQAARAGAHREAARLYELALRYAASLPESEWALLLEAYALECDHISLVHEGITARRRALDLWRRQGNPLKEGENLAYLMNMLTRAGQTAEAQQVSRASIQLLEGLPPGRELAMAYRVQAATCLVNRDCEEALAWAEKAQALAERLQDAEVLAAVHLTTGTAWLFLDYERGCQFLESKIQALQEAGLDARAAHIYSNLGSGSGELYQFRQAERYLQSGIAYAAERDLDSHLLYMQAWQALTQMHLGRWRDVELLALRVSGREDSTVTARITALVALGRLYARRGEGDAQAVFDEALRLADQAGNLQRLGAVRCARAEAAWLAGSLQQALEEVDSVYGLAISKRHPWFTGELAFWRWRAGGSVAGGSADLPGWTARPFALQISGDWQAAAAAWEQIGCPYEQARALAGGDTQAQIDALQIYEQLGARAAADQIRQTLRAAGELNLPRKPRASTRQNPFGLTDRQVEILALLTEGLNNAGIAARLHISEKTADHHVSAILAGLDVHSRDDAARLARSHPHFKK